MSWGAILQLLSFSLFWSFQTDALMFQSTAVKSQWDTWAFVENGTYYAYYLITEHSPGEGFGVATSTDGQHWTDHGYIFHGPSWALHRWWQGTGSVWRAADFNTTGRYLINFSEDPGNYQNITFAESFDLIHWSTPSPLNSTYFNIDTSLYKLPGRWDCIYSIPAPGHEENARDGYPRYGYWTATPINGSMGFGITDDGYNWRALPSPEMVPPVHAEVGAVEYIPYGPQNEHGSYFAMLGAEGHMVTYSAKNVSGPFYAATKNFEVLPQGGSCYFSRFFRGANMELLVTHQTFSHVGRTYIAPFKSVEVDDAGTLRFTFWQANEGFKGAEVPASKDPSSNFFSHAVNVSVGAVFEAQFVLPDAELTQPLQWPGFLLETTDNGAVTVAIDHTGKCTISLVDSAARPTKIIGVSRVWDRDLPDMLPGKAVSVRLLYRRDMLELYLNNYLMPVYLMPHTTGRLGLIPNGTALVSNVRQWDMSLPGAPDALGSKYELLV